MNNYNTVPVIIIIEPQNFYQLKSALGGGELLSSSVEQLDLFQHNADCCINQFYFCEIFLF